MDTKLKEKWLAALRGGDYKQGQDMLRSEDGSCFCCLGVLCDIIGPNEWSINKVDECDGMTYFGWVHPNGYGHNDALFGDALLDYDFSNSIGLGVDEQRDLAGMNDEGRTFEEIADYIEEYL
jgi:hypothetical protein